MEWELHENTMAARHPLDAPYDTLEKVKTATTPSQAVRLLEESMAAYEKEYAKGGYDTHTLDGGKAGRCRHIPTPTCLASQSFCKTKGE